MSGRLERARRGLPLVVAVALALSTAVGAVLIDRVVLAPSSSADATANHARNAAPTGTPSAVRVGPPQTPYETAVDVAAARGLRVWLEADLVKRWLAGPSSFQGAIRQIGWLARRPGVVGIKIADELGHTDGLKKPAEVLNFLRASANALHAAAPGKALLVDIVVPELGCLPGELLQPLWATVCATRARGKWPTLTLGQVDRYLKSGYIDTLDLSTNLFPDRTYAGWGTDRDEAQRAAWIEVHRRGWPGLVRIQARKALAHTGRYSATAAVARRDTNTYIYLPHHFGAAAVDIWTWRQSYRGEFMRLLDPGLRSNALWAQLVSRRAAGIHLFTHFSPNSTEKGTAADLIVLSRVFTDVFVAAGTG